ncbi:MAG: hypothetical protein Fur0011_1660 [Candidatus Microgenomates bacterium]
MISREHKFPLRTEFLEFRARANKSVTPHLVIYYVSGTMYSRLGVTIPKKVSKLATTRNYLKRLTYNALWSRVKDQKMDVVVVFKPLPLKKTSATKQLLLKELHV